MRSRQENINITSNLLMALIPFTIAYPIGVHNLTLLISFLFLMVTIPKVFNVFGDYKNDLLYWLLGIQVLLCFVGLLYTTDIVKGWADAERALYPIALMLLFPLIRYSSANRDSMLKSFAIGCCFLVIVAFVHAWISLDREEFNDIMKAGHVSFTESIGIQPLYLSVCFILILFFLLEKFRINIEKISLRKLFLIVVGVLLSISMVFFLRSKTALLVLPTLLIIYLVIVQKKRGWLVAFILLLVTLLTFLLDKNGPPEIINSYGRTVSHAFDQRLMIWGGAIEGIKEVPFLGAGTGDAQALLNRGYAKIGYDEGIANNYNAHNQYLQFMARNGLLELIIFLSVLSYSFWRSAKESNYTFLMFNMLVAFVMLTESFLSVQKGIVFFYFFLLAFNFLGDNKSEGNRVL